MKKLWNFIGRLIFWLSWPALWVYIKIGGPRARVLVVHDNKILLVRSWMGAGDYTLPGGGRERGETLVDAATRELKEETGIDLTANQLKLLFSSEYREHGLRTHYECFYVKLSQPPQLHLRKPELSGFTWVSPGDIVQARTSSHVLAAVRAYETLR